MKKAYCIRGSKSPVVTEYMNVLVEGLDAAGFNVENIGLSFRGLNRKDLVVSDSPLVAIRYMLRGFQRHAVWFQGVQPEESYMRRKSKIRFFVISMIEKYVLKKSDLVFFVSSTMLEHYEEKYGINVHNKCVIIPCFNDTEIYPDSFDKKTSGEETEFVYVGGIQEWQCFDETIKIYQRIEEQLDRKCKLSVYTNETEKAQKMINGFHINHYTVEFVAPEELHSKIQSANYGFILRRDVIVNRVATPTKLSNYIANGIIPIYTMAIRSFAKEDQKIGLGIPCDLDDVEGTVKKIITSVNKGISKEDLKHKCTSFFCSYYSRSKYISEVQEAAERLLS